MIVLKLKRTNNLLNYCSGFLFATIRSINVFSRRVFRPVFIPSLHQGAGPTLFAVPAPNSSLMDCSINQALTCSVACHALTFVVIACLLSTCCCLPQDVQKSNQSGCLQRGINMSRLEPLRGSHPGQKTHVRLASRYASSAHHVHMG